MCKELSRKVFIKKAGAVDVLHALANREKMTFGELSRELGMTSSTLSKRLKEGLALGLFEQILTSEGLKPIAIFKITERGRELFKSIEPILEDYYKTKKEITELEKQIKKKKEKIEELLDKVEVD